MAEWDISVYISYLPEGIFRFSERSHIFLHQPAIPLSGNKKTCRFFLVLNDIMEKQHVNINSNGDVRSTVGSFLE